MSPPPATTQADRKPLQLGGLLGGSWLTAMTGDLGGGRFDAAWLVTNFETGNPASTHWTKQHEAWADVDKASARYLGFEKWRGGHVRLNAQEMQFIVDQPFVGNRLAAGEIRAAGGAARARRDRQAPPAGATPGRRHVAGPARISL